MKDYTAETVHESDAGDAARQYDGDEINLLWTDPPYGTGKRQTGLTSSYFDPADPRRVCAAFTAWLPNMSDDGTMAVCCDYRLAPHITYAITDAGWSYRGEVIWEFGLGRPRSSWWPVRHNNILTFTKGAEGGLFDSSAIPRDKRLAPKPGYSDDKPAGSVWRKTMSNTDPERVGYPNQKPLSIVEPFVLAHTFPGDLVADPFMGSGTTGVAAIANGRRFYGCDQNPQAVKATRNRLAEIARRENR